jgi:hypothetical protein
MMCANYGDLPDALKTGTLSVDGMHIRQNVEFNGATLHIDGFGSDQQKPSLLVAEFKAAAGRSAAANAAKPADRPDLAKHYLVFYFTNADRTVSNVVARYCVTAVKGPWLADKFLDVVEKLAFAGFMVVAASGDGASENRLFLHLLFQNETAKLFVNDDGRQSTIDELPRSRCWFPHPCDESYRIYFIADMPHLIKKIRNALLPIQRKTIDPKRRKAGRSCKIFGKSVELSMAEAAYDGVGGCEGSELRSYLLTAAHFELDAWSKMRFYLAAQVLSSSMIRVIEEYCAGAGGVKEDYEGYVELCRNVDLLVDICNGTETSRRTGEKKGGKKLMKNIETDAESAKILVELKKILGFFNAWRLGCKEETETEFITEESWEDLCTLICGNIDLVTFYGAKFGSNFVWHFRSGGSDVVENHFANTRAQTAGGHVTTRQCKRAAEDAINNRLFFKVRKANVNGGGGKGKTKMAKGRKSNKY